MEKTFEERYGELYEQIEVCLSKLIEWKGVPSKHISGNSLQIDSLSAYHEIAEVNGNIRLLDESGYHYSLAVLDFDLLCEITDKVSIFNPNENKDYPVRVLADRRIDLSGYPNFHKSGSACGMKKLYYGKGALLVRDGDYIYNVTSSPGIYFEHSN